MNITQMKVALSIKGKNGLPFILSAVIVWIVITIIFLQTNDIVSKNVTMLISTGIMFPIAVIIAKIIKAEWRFSTDDIPIADLGLYINLAQFFYFPILFWAFAKNPTEMIVFFAIITGAHFYPYGWFYKTKVYYIFAPIISITIAIVGFTIREEEKLWIIPLAMIIFLLVISLLLYMDYQNKCNKQSTNL